MTQMPPQPPDRPPRRPTAGRRASRSVLLTILPSVPSSGTVLAVLAGIILLVYVVGPPLGSGHARLRRRSICGANLNTIGKGMHIYLDEYEQSPADIDVLIRYGASEKYLQCPSADKGRKSDYFFHFPTDTPVGNALVGCDLKGNHGEAGRNVLTYQGSVKWIKGEAAFQAELALPHNAEFARELRKVEGR